MGTIPKYQCRGKCAITAKPDPVIVNKLETQFKLLTQSESKSLLKKHLTRKIFDNIKLNKSKYGATLYDCIRTGLSDFNTYAGIFSADPDSYRVFAEIFDPIIEEFHEGFNQSQKQPDLSYGDVNSLEDLDPLGKFIMSVRIRCIRNIDQYPFSPLLTEEQYSDLSTRIAKVLTGLGNEYRGIYHPIETLDSAVKKKLAAQKILFPENDKTLESAQVYRFWPTGRGVFFNEDKNFVVWVNEKDHMRIISTQKGGDLKAVYHRLVKALRDIENKLFFTRDERLGFLTFDPSNLGTTIRASVHIKIPKLAKKTAILNALLNKFNLQLRSPSGEINPPAGGVLYDISNRQKCGLTEYDAVKTMHDGVIEIIKTEKSIKEKVKRERTWRELARRRLYRKRRIFRPYLPSHMFKT